MDNFSVITRLTKKDYIKYVYSAFYKKPQIIVTSLLGLYLIVTVSLNYFGYINYYSETPYFEFFSGLFILIGPTLIVLIAIRQFMSTPSLKGDVSYIFSEDNIVVKGLTFESVLKWSHIIKQKETSKYLLLYCSKKSANFVDKSKLSPVQIEFIKSKIGKT